MLDQTRPGYYRRLCKVANIPEAKAQLSRLIEEAQKGVEVILAKAGKPVAKIVPIDTTPANRVLGGSWEGRVFIANDFDELPPDLERALGVPPETST